MALGISLADDLEIAFTAFSGTLGAGTTTTLVLPSRYSSVNGKYVGKDVTVVGEATQAITAYVGSTRTATVATAYSTATTGKDFTLSLTDLDYATEVATAIDDYLSGGIYAAGAFTFSSAMTPSDLLLPFSTGSVTSAADKWSTALENYFSGGSTTPAAGNEAEAIFYPAVKSTLDAALQVTFAVTSNTAAAQATSIAANIATAVATITATYTVTSGPTVVPVPAPAIL